MDHDAVHRGMKRSRRLLGLLLLFFVPTSCNASFVLVPPSRTHRRRCQPFSHTSSLIHGVKKPESKSVMSDSSNKKKKKKQHARTTTTTKPKSSTVKAAAAASTAPRPLVTDYNVNCNPIMNQKRLNDCSIACEHFSDCSGCTVWSHVGEVDTIQSAKRFFSSTAIRRKRADLISRNNKQQQQQDINDENNNLADDGFYKVIVPSDVVEWRTQAKLAVAAKNPGWTARDQGCVFGLYKSRSHSVQSIPNCAVHHPSINKAVAALEAATAKVGTVPAFSDVRQQQQDGSAGGGLRYVQLQVERITQKVCLTLVWNAATIKDTQPAVSRLVKQLTKTEEGSADSLWHSIWVHCNDSAGNAIFNTRTGNWHRLMGPEFVREPLPVGKYGWLYFTPSSFRQANMNGFDVLAQDVAKAVPSGSKVCELYAGIGVLGLTALAFHAQIENAKPLVWLRCSDENPSNPRCFQRSVDSLPSGVTGRGSGRANGKKKKDDEMTIAELAAVMDAGSSSSNRGRFTTDRDETRTGDKTSYMVASAAAALRNGQALGANVLIVDPPRKGLEDPVLEELCKPFNPKQPYVESTTLLTISDDKINWTNDVQTLIYVSCGFDALARDAQALLASAGGWILQSATGYVLFPGSDHVETVCVFKRGIAK